MYGNQQKQYDPEKRVSLWNNDKAQSAADPVLKGNVVIDGVKYNISLWNGKGGNAKAPVLTGELQVHVPKQTQGGYAASSNGAAYPAQAPQQYGVPQAAQPMQPQYAPPIQSHAPAQPAPQAPQGQGWDGGSDEIPF